MAGGRVRGGRGGGEELGSEGGDFREEEFPLDAAGVGVVEDGPDGDLGSALGDRRPPDRDNIKRTRTRGNANQVSWTLRLHTSSTQLR